MICLCPLLSISWVEAVTLSSIFISVSGVSFVNVSTRKDSGCWTFESIFHDYYFISWCGFHPCSLQAISFMWIPQIHIQMKNSKYAFICCICTASRMRHNAQKNRRWRHGFHWKGKIKEVWSLKKIIMKCGMHTL